MLVKRVRGFRIILIPFIFLLFACAGLQPESNKPSRESGDPVLDSLIEKVLGGDGDELLSVLQFTPAECTNVEGLGGPPKCLVGEPENTSVQVLPFLGPEGHFIRKTDINNWEGLNVSELYAVYQVSDKAYSDVNYPAGEYALVFIGSPVDKTSITLQVRDGRIVRIDEGNGYPPVIREEDVEKYLLAPMLPIP